MSPLAIHNLNNSTNVTTLSQPCSSTTSDDIDHLDVERSILPSESVCLNASREHLNSLASCPVMRPSPFTSPAEHLSLFTDNNGFGGNRTNSVQQQPVPQTTGLSFSC